MVREYIRRVLERIRKLFQEEDLDECIERLGSRTEYGAWKCDFCGKARIQKKYPDLYRHIWSNHYGVVEEETSKETRARAESHHDDFSVGDYVDDYSLPSSGTEQNELEIQEASGGKNTNFHKYQIYYQRIVQEIERSGKYKISRYSKIGSVRGGHILQNFKSAVRRVEDDSLDNYEIENDGNGDYPIIIQAKH